MREVGVCLHAFLFVSFDADEGEMHLLHHTHDGFCVRTLQVVVCSSVVVQHQISHSFTNITHILFLPPLSHLPFFSLMTSGIAESNIPCVHVSFSDYQKAVCI